MTISSELKHYGADVVLFEETLGSKYEKKYFKGLFMTSFSLMYYFIPMSNSGIKLQWETERFKRFIPDLFFFSV